MRRICSDTSIAFRWVIEMYDRDIRALEALIQRDLSEWLDPERALPREPAIS
jgi:predicted nucleic acid-binding protein